MRAFLKSVGINFKNIKEVVSRYPLMIAIALSTALVLIISNSLEYTETMANTFQKNRMFFNRLAMIGFVGIPVAYAMNIWWQRGANYIFAQLDTIALLILLYLFLPDNLDSPHFMYAFILLTVMSILVISLIGFNLQSSDMSFWEFNKKLLVNTVLTILFSIILIGGVELAILGVDKLFDVGLDNSYFNVFVLLGIVGSTIIFLLLSKGGVRQLEISEPYPDILKFLVQYVLIPLILIYAVILYAFTVKSLMAWSLPSGGVTLLVSTYSTIGLLAYLLIYPLRDNSEYAWVRIFADVFFYSLLPLVIFMGIALYRRISEYGVTEPRYLAVIVWLWITGSSVYFILKKNASIKVIPASLLCLGFLALLFPKFNIFQFPVQSQYDRFVKTVMDLDLLDANKVIQPGQPIYQEALNNLSSITNFLAERNVLEKIKPFFPEHVSEQWNEQDRYIDMYQLFEVDQIMLDRNQMNWYNKDQNNLVRLSGYDYYLRSPFHSGAKEFHLNETFAVSFRQIRDVKNTRYQIILIEDESRYKIELQDHLESVLNDIAASGTTENDQLTKVLSYNDWQIKLLFNNMNVHEDQVYFDADVLVKIPPE